MNVDLGFVPVLVSHPFPAESSFHIGCDTKLSLTGLETGVVF